MADYQSSFSGEEIDDILAKAKSGDFTVQSDYAQNDSTQSDYIKNRPFYKGEGFKYEWDGDITGKELLSVVEGFDFYLISSNILSETELLGASVKSYFDGNDIEGEISSDGDITFLQTGAGNLIVMYLGQLPVIFVANQSGEDSFSGMTYTVPSTGLWFLHSTGEKEYTHYLQKNFSIKTLDEEYLPETVITEADKGVPNGVATLDSDGKIPVEQLPDDTGGGEGGTLEQQQTDYEENDTSKVTFIKNRPFYVVSEEVVTVTKEDYQNDPIYQAMSAYVLGDYVPLRDYTTEVFWTLLDSDGTPFPDLTNMLLCNDVECQYSEPILKAKFNEGGMVGFVYESGYSYMLGSEIPKAGIWTSGLVEVIGILEADTGNVGCSIEFTIRKLKRIDSNYIGDNGVNNFTLQIESLTIGEPIDVSSIYEDLKYSCVGAKPTNLYLFYKNIGSAIQCTHIGLGSFLINLIGAVYFYALNEGGVLSPISKLSTEPLSESTETTTYSLRQPSLADTINASLEERGLKIDLSNYDGTWIKNEVTQ